MWLKVNGYVFVHTNAVATEISVPFSLPLPVSAHSLNIIFPTYFRIWPYINLLLRHWNLDELSCHYSFCSKISYLVHYFLQNFTPSKDLKYDTQIRQSYLGYGKDWMFPSRQNYSANLRGISSLWKFSLAVLMNRPIRCCQRWAELCDFAYQCMEISQCWKKTTASLNRWLSYLLKDHISFIFPIYSGKL